ncbi:MAG: O-antigen polymerase [Thermoanaerobaculia bacterium]
MLNASKVAITRSFGLATYANEGMGAERGLHSVHKTMTIGSGCLAATASVAIASEATVISTVVVPMVYAAAALFAALMLLRRNPVTVWAPTTWFLITTATYFGVGPLVYTFGDYAAVTSLNQYFYVDAYTLGRVVTLTMVGLFSGFLGALAGDRIKRTLLRHLRPVRLTDRQAQKVFWFLVMFGGIVKYTVALPYSLGLLSYTLPGGIYSLGRFTTAALILTTYLAFRRVRPHRAILPILFAAELISALVIYAKLEVLLAFMAVVIGAYYARPSRKLLLVGAVLCVTAYLLLVPFVSYARSTFSHSGGSISSRLEAIAGYTFQGQSEDDRFGAWRRISYVNAQAFAMHLHDSGNRGRSLALAVYSFVPRILWPGKPITTDIGMEFNYLATGIRTSSSTPTPFGEGYWNGGWAGVVLFGLYIGVVLSVLSHMTLAYVLAHDFRWLPCAFFVVVLGASPDMWFAPTFIGSLPILAAQYALMMGLFRYSQRGVAR